MRWKHIGLYLFLLCCSCVEALTPLIGAGSSLAYPVMGQWSYFYNEQVHQEVNYQALGSGGGLSELKKKNLDFAALDMPLDQALLTQEHWIQFPLVFAGIVVAVHIPGVDGSALRLTGSLLARIFLGHITRWNDSEIQNLNPTLNLPDLSIVPIHRADGSGTSYHFTRYLSSVYPMWKKRVGFGTQVHWPFGLSGKGNSGVAFFTQRIPGSIGYMEYSFAQLSHLDCVQLQNQSGIFVTPKPAFFRSESSNQTHCIQCAAMVNGMDAHSWPLVATVFIVLPVHTSTHDAVLKFIDFAYRNGEKAKQLEYVPLSESLIERVRNDWNTQEHLK